MVEQCKNPIDLDKSKRYMIVGSPKSGTNSLMEYMINNGFDIIKNDLAFCNQERVLEEDIDRIPIIVLRNPIERAWSDFNFFDNVHFTLEEACEWSKYEKHIKLWNNPIIFQFEELIKIKDFPNKNKNLNKKKLDEVTRKKIQNILLEE